MTDSMKNKELIAVGHEFARSLSNDTPIIEIAKMITRLAGRLDCATLALREMTKQRDAADQAERVWERTMMDACGEDGPKSVADKFAELKAQCAALVAEGAGLKSAAQFATADDMWIEQADGMLDYRYVEWYVDVLKAAMETPVTDAILAEVRAQGVEMFAASLKVVSGNEHPYSAVANEFAAKIRQEAK